MSCAFLSCGEACRGSDGSETSLLACPFSGMANGLHAMAQPLTVLRGALGAWKMRGGPEAENGHYLQMSTNQVERMSDLLSCLQDVLDVADSKPNRSKVDIGAMIGLVLEDMSSVLQEWGGTIEGLEPDCHVQIQGDADRTERALRAAIRVAVSLSAHGEVIRLSVRRDEEQVQVHVESSASHRKTLGFADRLNLSLVETNIRSQNGAYECVEDPLCVLISLPAFGIEATDPPFTIECEQARLID